MDKNKKLYELLDQVESLAELEAEQLVTGINDISSKFNDIVSQACEKIDLEMKSPHHLAPDSEQNSEVLTRIKHMVSTILLTQIAQTAKKLQELADGNILDNLDQISSYAQDYKMYQDGLHNGDAFETIGVIAFFIGYGLGCQCENKDDPA